jgi:hypothetical protein
MKRVANSTVLFFFVLAICACAGTDVQRSMVDDNIFFSSSKPKIRIKIDSAFKLIKDNINTASGFDTRGTDRSSNVKVEQYYFLGSAPKMNKSIMIEFKELTSPRWQFDSTLFKADNVYDSGSINIHGKSYQYMVFAFPDQGDTYNIVRGYGRRVGANSNAIICVYYLERVAGDWRNLKRLSSEQQTHLDKFIEDSKKDIEILK